jgi:hypothetical protein
MSKAFAYESVFHMARLHEFVMSSHLHDPLRRGTMGIMKRSTVALAAAVLLGGAQSASAQTLAFYTQGTFSSGSGACNGTNVCTFGGAGQTLTFWNTSGAYSPILNPTIVSLGYFTFGLPTTGTSTAPLSASFTLDIFQTLPGTSLGTGQFVGSVSGQITGNASQVYWYPTNTSVDIATNPNYVTTYNLENYLSASASGPRLAISAGFPPSTVIAEATVTPEPGTMVLMLTGFAGLAGVVYRRRKSVEA